MRLYTSGDLLDEETAAAVIRTAEELRAGGACVRLADLRVSGSDLMPLGFAGPKIGLALNTLLDCVMREETENDRDVLLRVAEELASRN